MPCKPPVHRPVAPAHQRQAERAADLARGSAASRGYGRQWRKARVAFLARHPLCVEHERAGYVVEATVVDHVQPHRGDARLFWSAENWQPLCKACHDRKTGQGG